jgi:nuclear pore complex protein Nup62
MWLLGIELRTSGRAVSALNHSAISPAHVVYMYTMLCDHFLFLSLTLYLFPIGSLSAFMSMCVCVCVCVYVCMYVCVNVYVYCVCVSVYMWVSICMYVYCMCMYVYA